MASLWFWIVGVMVTAYGRAWMDSIWARARFIWWRLRPTTNVAKSCAPSGRFGCKESGCWPPAARSISLFRSSMRPSFSGFYCR